MSGNDRQRRDATLERLPSLDGGMGSAIGYAGLHFDPGEFDALIRQYGVCVRWRRGVPCPCRRADSNHAAMECAICRGMGFAYPAELEEPLEVLISSRKFSREVQAAGAMTSGTVQITFPATLGPGEPLVPSWGDQVWPENEVHTVTEIVYRGGMPDMTRQLAHLHAGPHPPLAAIGEDRDRLLYPDLTVIEYVGWVGPDGRLVRAREGFDFKLRVDADGGQAWIEWLHGERTPPRGRAFTARYRAPAVYMLLPAEPRARYETGTMMPYSAEGQRLDKLSERDLR